MNVDIAALEDACGSRRCTFTGHFECRGENLNDWHFVDITYVGGNKFRWTNRAGVSWTLTSSEERNELAVGRDCPYYCGNGDNNHTVLRYHGHYLEGPNGGKYYRK